MSRANIVRMRKIADFRAFQTWTDESRAAPLKRVNLIYGTNGSGKSTLANLFRHCAGAGSAGPTRAVGVEFDATVDGIASVITESSSDFWARTKVFNAAYVRENLRFDDDGGPQSESVLTLGEANVDTEEKLRLAENRKSELAPLAREARIKTTSLERALGERLTAVAGQVVEDLRASPVATYRATNSYTRANVRTLLKKDRTVFDDASRDVAADRATATSPAMDAFTKLSRARLLDGPEVLVAANELLMRDVTSKVIETLAGRPREAKWVQDGIDLHDHREECLFCGGAITANRRAELAAHFDSSLINLQKDINTLISKLSQAFSAAQQMAESIPRDGDLYPDFAGELRTARSTLRDQSDRYRSGIETIIAALKDKAANPFAEPEVVLPHIEAPSMDEVAAVVASHEHRRTSHNSEATAAARRVELARVKVLAKEFDDRSAEFENQKELADQLEDELQTVSDQIIALSNVDADPVPKAAELTDDVARLLGRGELRFQPTADGKHYKIERSNQPATHLSEGERTAIALLHFLASVQRNAVAGDAPIVVIDDPVSSMDEGILFGVSSFLWATLVENDYASQVILLTHNFELFRQWVLQLENAGKHVPGGFTIHEVRMRFRSRGTAAPRRLPQFDPWTKDKLQSRRLRSLYHFLFARVANAILEATPELGLAERMDLLALAPNAARKMVEAFLSFRYPQHIGNFHAGMKAAISELDEPSVRTHVERYLHAYSHNEEGNISAMIDPSEATVVLRSLFLRMKANDPKHVAAMCESLQIDEDALFTIPA
ncbi:AAA family ATPase [Rathayibacter agropyri]|uniref:AAA family ATPase n=1 Tax=Rathayibacter agropyri TaxID=1634927 RepID=UPI0015669E35|nr:AAA family ATPase [Rathayibacter agropyri]NRD07626.1 AAA family ATPase [Rathayibacter agropyri]